MTKTNSRSRSKAPAPTREEEAARDTARHAPVSLPSGGSYDREALQEHLEKVVDADPDKRDGEIAKALDKADGDAGGTEQIAPNAIPGHKLVTAEVQLAPGTEIETNEGKRTVGSVTVKEHRQVLDPDAEVDLQSAATGGQAPTGNRSEILSTEDADAHEPAPSAEHSGE
jgi:hypothetical protein